MVARRQVFVLILRSALIWIASLSGGSALAATPAELYRLVPQDLVQMSIFGEDDMTADRRVDAHGSLHLPLLGAVKVAGLTLPDAETAVREAYVTAEIFIAPQVSLTVLEYAAKEISVLGQVASPGKQTLPNERGRISIVEAISSAGGFTRIAKADAVRVTRGKADGGEEVFTVNVENLINGRVGETSFYVQPGDIVFVPERVF